MTDNGTVAALLDAAEGEFATRGVEHGSLREIMRSANADSGSVHYHFGTRDLLAEEVLRRILEPLNERRLELLDAATGDHAAPASLDRLVEALVRPDIEAAVALDERGAGRARLIGAIYVRPDTFVKALVEKRFGPVAQAFMPHLIAAVPHVGVALLGWRVRWAVFGIVGAVLSDDAPAPAEAERLIRRIVSTASGAIGAADPEE